MALTKGDQVPHFTAAGVDGRPAPYRDVWQRRNLLLVCFPQDETEADARYRADLLVHGNEVAAHDTALVVTRDEIAGVPRPGVLVADRWGEIQWVAAARVEELPAMPELIEWLRYVQMKCPECEGETR